MKQKIFDYDIPSKLDIENFYVSKPNIDAYNYVTSNNKIITQTIIFGPNKSGKTHLGLIWKNNNNAIIFNDKKYEYALNNRKNIFIDNFFDNLDEEQLFHIINHCINHNLKILLTSNKSLNDYKFKYLDLSSRLKSFNFININIPNDELILNLLIKLLSDKQIIIHNSEIFSFILKRINRTYENIYRLVEKIDKLSLEKKRQLTIPLIRELL